MKYRETEKDINGCASMRVNGHKRESRANLDEKNTRTGDKNERTCNRTKIAEGKTRKNGKSETQLKMRCEKGRISSGRNYKAQYRKREVTE